MVLRSLPLANGLVRALTETAPTPAAQSYLAVGTIAATGASIRVDVVSAGAVSQLRADKLVGYTATVADPVLVAVIGQRCIIIGKIG